MYVRTHALSPSTRSCRARGASPSSSSGGDGFSAGCWKSADVTTRRYEGYNDYLLRGWWRANGGRDEITGFVNEVSAYVGQQGLVSLRDSLASPRGSLLRSLVGGFLRPRSHSSASARDGCWLRGGYGETEGWFWRPRFRVLVMGWIRVQATL
jgi:hypothetical protein